ncbi:MAG: purine-binding chemotaxis protein CheW [Gammaproteobacteria bacterium]|nr:purine-binding chemotaxis protein CheW [Gammaproteobacteria bacterium]
MGDLITQDSEQKALTETEDTTQYLTFLAGDERFAIGILDVKELIEVSSMTRVPMTPDFIRGVINLRGSVVPVIDLASRLGRSTSDLTKRSCIVLVEIILEDEGQTIGMLVDEVNQILEISQTHIQPPPNFGTDIRTDFIKAMGRVDDEFIILLNINHVLSIEELSALGELKSSLPASSIEEAKAKQ